MAKSLFPKGNGRSIAQKNTGEQLGVLRPRYLVANAADHWSVKTVGLLTDLFTQILEKLDDIEEKLDGLQVSSYNDLLTKTCPVCEKEFKTRKTYQKYCSNICYRYNSGRTRRVKGKR